MRGNERVSVVSSLYFFASVFFFGRSSAVLQCKQALLLGGSCKMQRERIRSRCYLPGGVSLGVVLAYVNLSLSFLWIEKESRSERKVNLVEDVVLK